MSRAKVTAEQQHHKDCPHLYLKRSRRERERRIAYGQRPVKEIDVSCNVHPKCLQLATTNIPTLAFEKFMTNPVLPEQCQTNFSSNFYLENLPDNSKLCNTLLEHTKNEMAEESAYVLAAGAIKDYQQFSKKRQQYLANARRRAETAFNQFYFNQRVEQDRKKAELSRWITEYFRKVQELIDHIFKNKENQDPNLLDKLFLKEQAEASTKKLGAIKITNPEAALAILQSLRAILLQQKIALEQERKDQEHNKSVSASFMDASNNSSQNLSGTSFMSTTTFAPQEEGQADFVAQFCDYQVLQKKWGKQNVAQVKDILRMMLCRNRVSKAEGVNAQQTKKGLEKYKKQKEKMQKQIGKIAKGRRNSTIKAKSSISGEEKPMVLKERLSKEQQTVKATLLKGGIYDSVGDIYQRNRKYLLHNLVTVNFSPVEVNSLVAKCLFGATALRKVVLAQEGQQTDINCQQWKIVKVEQQIINNVAFVF